MNRHDHGKTRGMTLVEVLIATMIVMVAVLSVSAVYLYSGKETVRAIRQAEAARLAQAIRMYAVQEFVNPTTAVVIDVPAVNNTDVVPADMFGGPETLPNRLISTPVRLVWRFKITGGAVDKGVHQHAVTVWICVDIDGNNIVSLEPDETVKNDDLVSTYVFYLYDTAP